MTVHSRRRLRPTPVVRAALLVASAGIAAGLAALVWSQLPQRLNVHTDIVGYPEAAPTAPRAPSAGPCSTPCRTTWRRA